MESYWIIPKLSHFAACFFNASRSIDALLYRIEALLRDGTDFADDEVDGNCNGDLVVVVGMTSVILVVGWRLQG
jgi:hypothetical protein